MGNPSSFCIIKDKKKKKKKVHAARFLDARGDAKQVIYLERPYGETLYPLCHDAPVFKLTQ